MPACCRCLLIVSVVMSPTLAAEPKFTNRLARESSPYLLQHAHNPVDWHPWGEEAFAKARKESKLIFLSSGYSSCHWCHVMERECFTNEEIAALLNAHFVCIKLDREERPDVDHLYLTALQVMGRSGGWPLSMFLTADGKPIAGGTYWPPDDREIDGELAPGFKSVLKAVVSAHQGAPENLIRTAELRALQTRQQLALAARPVDRIELNHALIQSAVQELQQTFDPEHGGFGTPPAFRGPKFPRPPLLALLQADSSRNRSPELSRMLQLTLERLARGGICDQLGGGFHRYSVERTWTVPHFEKMLYDNAQLLQIYASAYSSHRSALYEQTLRQTLEYVVREMTSPEGLFLTAIDADSSGEEGRYYVWTDEELVQALPDADDLAFFRKSYSLSEPNFEGRYFILTKPADVPDQARLSELSRRLLAIREQRPRPMLDTKVLTSWNGLMIAGVAAAGQALGDSLAIQRAARAADALLTAVKTPSGRLHHTYAAAPGDKPKPRIPGYLDDYTHVVHGLLVLHDVTRDERWLTEARSLTDAMIVQFHDQAAGGFFYTSAEHEVLFARIKDQYDGVQPCGNSQAAANLVALWRRTGMERYRDLARETFETFAAHLRDEPRSLCTMTAALAEFLEQQQPAQK